MAKKVKGVVKLQIPAGAANPAPPVGPALGSAGVNIMQFCKEFNAKTHVDVKRLVELFRAGMGLDELNGLFDGDRGLGGRFRYGAIFLAVLGHFLNPFCGQSTTSMPMLRAVPAIMRIAASTSVVLRSAFFISTIFAS